MEKAKKSYLLPSSGVDNIDTSNKANIQNNNTQVVKDKPVEMPVEQNKAYDLNDNDLLNLILNENDTLNLENKANTNIESQYANTSNSNALNVQEILKDINRGSAGHYVKTFKDYSTVPERRTEITSNILTKKSALNEQERTKRSLPYQGNVLPDSYLTNTNDSNNVKPNSPYKNSEPLQASLQNTSTSNLMSSQASNKNVEEWSYQKYATKVADEEEVEDSNLCGLCVSRRQLKPKIEN